MSTELLEAALYSRLSGGTALTTELGGTYIYNKRAHQPPPDKYVVFQWQAGGDENESPHRTRNVIYTVRGVGLTQATAAGIDTEVDALLHNQVLTVTGWTNFWLARENDINFIEDDAAGVPRFHVGAQYRIRLDND